MKQLIYKTASGVCLYEDNHGKFYSENPEAVIAALKEDLCSGEFLARVLASELLDSIYDKGITKIGNLHVYVSSNTDEDVEILIISVNSDRAALQFFKRKGYKGSPIKVI